MDPITTFDAAVALMDWATTPYQVFGPVDDDHLTDARTIYRRLAKLVHPDVAPGDQVDEAHQAIDKLNALWDDYQKGIKGGFEVPTKLRTYRVEPLLRSDELSNWYPCSWDDGTEQYGMLRLPRDPRDNDLIQAEARAFKFLDSGIPKYRPYAPELVEAFRFRDPTKRTERQAVVTKRLEGFYTLEQVHQAYPDGIDGRDAAWMWRRLLAGAGWFHQAGLVHGAVLPPNILIQPLQHGVVFTNWAYSVASQNDHVPAMVKGYEGWYPQHVTEKRPAVPGIDIDMASRCMMYVLGDHAPVQFRGFARGCAAHAFTEWGSQQAWEVQRQFDELLERLYGKRKYRPFFMPDQV